MNRYNQKEPLYRKVNTRARNVRHNFCGDFKYSRSKRQETLEQITGTKQFDTSTTNILKRYFFLLCLNF